FETLGSDEHFLAALLQDAFEVLMRLGVAGRQRLPRPRRRGIDVGDAEVNRLVQERDGLFFVFEIAHGDGAEAEDRNLDVRFAEDTLRQFVLVLRRQRQRVAQQERAGGAGAEEIASVQHGMLLVSGAWWEEEQSTRVAT